MRFHSFFAPCIAVTLCAWLGACGQTQPNGAVVSHDERRPFNTSDSWNWQSTTEDQYHTIVAPFWTEEGSLGTSRDHYLPQSHQAVQVLKQWTQRIDTALRTRYPDEFRAVPRPDIKVLKTADVNAWVSAVPVCVTNVQIDLRRGHLDATATVPAAVVYNGHLFRGDAVPGSDHCISRMAKREELDDRVARDINNGTCRFTVALGTTGYVMRAADDCQLDDSFKGVGTITTPVVLGTSHWVTFTTAIIRSMPEPELVAILGHELGHYYKSHVTMMGRYQYAYPLTVSHPAEAPRRPTPLLPVLTTFDRTVNATLAALDGLRVAADNVHSAVPAGIFAPVAGQQFHSALVPLVISSLDYAVSYHCWQWHTEACTRECKLYDILYSQSTNALRLGRLVRGPLDPAEVTQYLELERRASACLAATPLSSTAGQVFPRELLARLIDEDSHKRLFKKLVGPDLPGATLLEFWTNASQKMSTYPAYSIANTMVYSGAIDAQQRLSTEIGRWSSVQDSVERHADEQHLGVYSSEQEADQLALEFSALIGVDPQAAVDGEYTFLKMFDQTGQTESREVGYAECRARQQAGWRNNGVEAPINIATLEAHHQTCFRVFDMDVEIRAHRYDQRFRFDATFLPTLTWQELQNSLPPGLQDLVASGGAHMSNQAVQRPLSLSCKTGTYGHVVLDAPRRE